MRGKIGLKDSSKKWTGIKMLSPQKLSFGPGRVAPILAVDVILVGHMRCDIGQKYCY